MRETQIAEGDLRAWDAADEATKFSLLLFNFLGQPFPRAGDRAEGLRDFRVMAAHGEFLRFSCAGEIAFETLLRSFFGRHVREVESTILP